MPIPLRSDFSASQLRALARKTKHGPQARRLLALAAIYEGASRTEAARIGGVTLQIVRDWVLKFNTHGPEGLIDRKPPGQPSRLTDQHRQHLVQMIEAGPIPAIPSADLQADPEPGSAGAGLSQALGSPAASCQERGDCIRF